MTNENDFNQPQLGDTLPETNLHTSEANNTGKTDELSLAIADENANKGRQLILPEVEASPLKFWIGYYLDGVQIEEKHATLEAAIARVRALKVINIIPATGAL